MPLIQPQALLENCSVAIVVSRYHSDITQKLLSGAQERLEELGFTDAQITILWVPGAVEIPITAQRLARTRRYDAIICFGAVVFGETKHFDYVCEQVSQGCQQVALSNDLPVIFGVLTTQNMDQAYDRVGGKKGHVGKQSVDAVVELISVLRQI